MTHIIINTPSVYSAKLPAKGWINLAQIRLLEVNEDNSTVIVTWQNGEKQLFQKNDAKALVDAWNEAASILQSKLNHLYYNRRVK